MSKRIGPVHTMPHQRVTVGELFSWALVFLGTSYVGGYTGLLWLSVGLVVACIAGAAAFAFMFDGRNEYRDRCEQYILSAPWVTITIFAMMLWPLVWWMIRREEKQAHNGGRP
jgi:NADH:ubiquinone oxidoreductase subunit 6 (subunit J)